MDKLKGWLLEKLNTIAPADTITTPAQSAYNKANITNKPDGVIDFNGTTEVKTWKLCWDISSFFICSEWKSFYSVERTESLKLLEKSDPSFPKAFRIFILEFLDKVESGVDLAGNLKIGDGRIDIAKTRKAISSSTADFKKEGDKLLQKKIDYAAYCKDGRGDRYNFSGKPLTNDQVSKCNEEYNQLIGLKNYFNTNF